MKTRFIDGLLSACAALALWQAVVWLTGVPSFILPGPGDVLTALIDNRALIAENAGTTIIEVLIGLVLGAAIGGATALHLMISPMARRLLLPLMVFSQAIPIFALAPILTLWLGYGMASKIAVTVLMIFFPVVSTFYDGLRRTDPGLLDLARTMGATPMSTLLRLRLPAALPAFGSGLRLAAVYAPIGAVVGEWVGASKGLGYLMLLANGRAKVDLMFAALFVLAAFTVLLHAVTSVAARRMASWSKETDGR
ncbi:ABC transporter permease [Mesorhizobium sp. RMAD-H1]|uniref:ABC transporter permease n=1 Tax=Mesorhizobium sp. RMAD-H1 TaxID=2587065 RepID=UPI00160FA9D2|nr:ABC transporter permease [Mesorhizobium sp. RMAD-H1]MBB2972259.1 putative hydroxymethylpyrimidine transport system permease protein [Mesorhizobium sp. RMAD-H1]